jgi:hypothetical protein
MTGTRFAVIAALAGGLLAPASANAQTPTPTFTKDVAPIFYKNCVACHRAGEIGPMSLLTYNDARPYARSIVNQVSKGTMPPWHADPAHGEFQNDRRLSAADKNTILSWANGGTPEGNPKDLPPAPVFPTGWSIQPDAVFTMQEDYPVPANGTIEYKYFEVPTNFTEDRWIQAFEVRPGSRTAVHHVIVFARPARPAAAQGQPQAQAQASPQQGQGGAPGQTAAAPPQGGARRQGPITFAPGMEEPAGNQDEAAKRAPLNDRPSPAGGTGAFVGAYVPGTAVRTFEPGTAIRLTPGATLVFQMHYTAKGKATSDRTKIGFVFAKQPPKTELIIAALLNQNFTLPAGKPDARVDAEMTLNQDMTVYSVLPHTHVRGKKWEVTVTYPDGRSELVLAVPNYDFNWQTDYIFKEPLKLPKGTKVHTTAWYDNSAASKTNPDPTKDVHWGDQTWQEMQFTAFTFSIDQMPSPASGAQQQ